MKILIVGGTGLIGGHAALHLHAQGNPVTLAARKPPAPGSALAQFDVLLRDYVAGNFTRDDLAPFDAVVFAAGNDIRHLPPGTDEAAHWERANVDAVPRFFALARDAGVKRAVLVGSFYPQVAPALVDTVPYVRSRHLADERVRALATRSFAVCSVNAPFVVGSVPGLRNEMFAAYTGYAQGRFAGLPVFGPAGGSNFISTQSLSEAIWGALQRGEAGKAYLVGDENLSFADYFAAFFRAAGNPRDVPSLDQEHPLLPDIAIYTGRGNVVSYEPDPADSALLRYRRGDVQRAVDEVVAHCRAQ
ncbi:nucleoside-diphosphate sugar epimerase [Burkholderia cepacia]|uniref:NAD-dependent epimerase/dehydratase family protein n=1 Tax=Burkholderia cepacia TaxID=292 RepID=UPI00075F98DD|nr:NAD-dependent epimerase/dehydratase family protein [Burkholderia cepacia]KWE19504.1 nucleoside-diphosphate sugar epimerase [Burkholderia cepacia]